MATSDTESNTHTHTKHTSNGDHHHSGNVHHTTEGDAHTKAVSSDSVANHSAYINSQRDEHHKASVPMVTTSGTPKRWNWKTLALLTLVGMGLLGYFTKHLFVAATVDGQMISRFSVIRMLEAQGGTNALDALITKKLVESAIARAGVEVDEEAVDAAATEIETQIAAQGGTLDELLTTQGMTKDEFRKQITIQKQIESLLAEKAVVTDADVDAFMTEQKITTPKDTDVVAYKEQFKEQLKQQKLQGAVGEWLEGLRSEANITRYVTY
jgi:parvulin-like peptidyl-prolyl isomerase